jgi:hypothetical protein
MCRNALRRNVAKPFSDDLKRRMLTKFAENAVTTTPTSATPI